ncbi:hypothetical protein SDC9_206242 [bioreactor metagenome]|uniref:Uncharacterized protein n=1 Tax=bioreactor metagenome TaxID=1076179 RepID=A0A645J573_9ZZZZ
MPLSRFTSQFIVPSGQNDFSSLANSSGKTKNSPTDRITARKMAVPITILSMPLPSFLDSHFSNFVGSSSKMPSISVLCCNVVMPMESMVTKLTIPRTKGQPIHGCFLAGLSYTLRRTTMVWSGRRTAMAIASGDFIITPSITACPPISTLLQLPCSFFISFGSFPPK